MDCKWHRAQSLNRPKERDEGRVKTTHYAAIRVPNAPASPFVSIHAIRVVFRATNRTSELCESQSGGHPGFNRANQAPNPNILRCPKQATQDIRFQFSSRPVVGGL